MDYLGLHMSTTGGLESILDKMKQLNIRSVQIFARNPRSVGSPTTKMDRAIVKKIREGRRKWKIFVHASYGVRLFKSPPEPISVLSLVRDIRFLDKFGKSGIGVVAHSGSVNRSVIGWSDIKKNIIATLVGAVKKTRDSGVKIFIENQVKNGNKLITTVNEMIDLWKDISKVGILRGRIGMCYDTCHGFVSNKVLDLNTSTVFSDIKKLHRHGVKIGVVHLNDSSSTTADRHENLFDGYIPKKNLMGVVRFCTRYKIPMIIERSRESFATWDAMIKLIRS